MTALLWPIRIPAQIRAPVWQGARIYAHRCTPQSTTARTCHRFSRRSARRGSPPAPRWRKWQSGAAFRSRCSGTWKGATSAGGRLGSTAERNWCATHARRISIPTRSSVRSVHSSNDETADRERPSRTPAVSARLLGTTCRYSLWNSARKRSCSGLKSRCGLLRPKVPVPGALVNRGRRQPRNARHPPLPGQRRRMERWRRNHARRSSPRGRQPGCARPHRRCRIPRNGDPVQHL